MRLVPGDGETPAEPILGKSGLLRTMLEVDGLEKGSNALFFFSGE